MDIHSTDSNNLTKRLMRSGVMKVLFAAMFLVTVAFQSQAEETFPPTSMTVASAQACVGDDVTVTIQDPDTAGANTLQSVPWQISHNGALLSSSELADFIALDASTGSTLENWTMSTSLSFEVLQAGCYVVTLENGALEIATNNPDFPVLAQIVTPTEFVVSGAPSAPVVSDYSAVLCAGDLFSASMSTGSEGPESTTLSYTLVGPTGATLDNDDVSASGLGCNGPSLSLGLSPIALEDLGGHLLAVNATNVCGSSPATFQSVEVVAAPTFALSTDPVCDGEDALVVSDIEVTDYDNDVAGTPTAEWSWSSGNSSLGLTNLINPADGDVVEQTVDLVYTVIDDNGTSTATCSASASATQVVHTPTPLELSFNGASSASTLCAGDMLDVAVVSETSVLEVKVPQSPKRPHYVEHRNAQGEPVTGAWNAFLRKDDRIHKASPVMVKVWQYEMRMDRSEFRYDEYVGRLFKKWRDGHQLRFPQVARTARLEFDQAEDLLALLTVWGIVEGAYGKQGWRYGLASEEALTLLESEGADAFRWKHAG